MKGLKKKDKVIVKVEDERIVVEKKLSKKEKEKLMKEYCLKHAKENEELSKEMEISIIEAQRFLDDY